MAGHLGAGIIAGGEVVVVNHGTLLNVDGVGDVFVTAVYTVVRFVSRFINVLTKGVLDFTCVQPYYIQTILVNTS